MLSTIAILVGVGVLGAYMLDLHSHTCAKCGRRWRHFGAFNIGDEDSHTCSQCGEVQWWKCGAPHVMHGSQFVGPPRSPVLAPAAPFTPPFTVVPGSGNPGTSLPGMSRASLGPPAVAGQEWRRPPSMIPAVAGQAYPVDDSRSGWSGVAPVTQSSATSRSGLAHGPRRMR